MQWAVTFQNALAHSLHAYADEILLLHSEELETVSDQRNVCIENDDHASLPKQSPARNSHIQCRACRFRDVAAICQRVRSCRDDKRQAAALSVGASRGEFSRVDSGNPQGGNQHEPASGILRCGHGYDR